MMRYLFVQAHFYKQISEDDDEVILRPHGFLVPPPTPAHPRWSVVMQLSAPPSRCQAPRQKDLGGE